MQLFLEQYLRVSAISGCFCCISGRVFNISGRRHKLQGSRIFPDGWNYLRSAYRQYTPGKKPLEELKLDSGVFGKTGATHSDSQTADMLSSDSEPDESLPQQTQGSTSSQRPITNSLSSSLVTTTPSQSSKIEGGWRRKRSGDLIDLTGDSGEEQVTQTLTPPPTGRRHSKRPRQDTPKQGHEREPATVGLPVITQNIMLPRQYVVTAKVWLTVSIYV